MGLVVRRGGSVSEVFVGTLLFFTICITILACREGQKNERPITAVADFSKIVNAREIQRTPLQNTRRLNSGANDAMPFTVTHVAAVIPIAWLSRWQLPFSALVFGAMVPDMAGYYPAILDYNTSHSVAGVMTHCTPIGVCLYYVYQTFLKQPFFDLCPSPMTTRMRPWIEHPVHLTGAGVLTVTFCVCIGALTHILWDSFTHREGWAVTKFPVLIETVGKLGGRKIRWYAVFQHGSSFLLIPMLVGFSLWLRKLPKSEDPVDRARFPKQIAWFILTAVVVGGAFYFQDYHMNHPKYNWIMLLTRTVKACGTITLSLFLIYALGMNLLWWQERKRPDHTVEETSL